MYAGEKMRVPWYRLSGRGWPSLLAVLLPVVATLGAHALPRGPQPDVKLQLADLGFPGVPQGFQDNGASMLTVHFVDSAHLLLTYSMRGLVERIPDDPPDDDDRAVAALLLELPSGKVLARARWHLHDHGQYLWNLGSGRFLLRVRSTLTAIAPLANLASGDAFREMPFLRSPGRISVVEISPEHDLVTVESVEPLPRQQAVFGDVPQDNRHSVELFSFERISGTGSPESPIRPTAAGELRVMGVGGLPINGRGYLFTEDGKRDLWKMQFEGFDGQSRKLSDLQSSCPPHMQFVSPSQFVVFSCRGSSDNLTLSAFNFSPREMWEEPMNGAVPFDQFAYAQEAGRFALSRMTSSSGSGDLSGYGPAVFGQMSSSAAQEVRVYQVESGDLLLKLSCTPAVRAGQNFDLSADGLKLVALRDGGIEVYRLPPLSEQDRKDLAEVRQYEPPANTDLVQLRRIMRDATTAEAAAAQIAPAADATNTQGATAAVPASAPAPAAVPTPGNTGDIETRRKPPSLLNPGESVEGKSAPAEH